MKKATLFILLSCALTILLHINTRADVSIDATNATNGIVTIILSELGDKTIKAQVEKDGGVYYYTIIKTSVNLPLQMGTGNYKISVLESVGNGSYRVLKAEIISVDTIDDMKMYTASIPFVEYSVSTEAVPAFAELVADTVPDGSKISLIYNDIVVNYKYDHEKALTVTSDYVPVIDDIFNDKKGICYDYAAILAAALRSQNIPSRLVMGYTPLVSGYHAWNEIWIDGKWVTVDATYDAAVVEAGYDYTPEKDNSEMTIIKIY